MLQMIWRKTNSIWIFCQDLLLRIRTKGIKRRNENAKVEEVEDAKDPEDLEAEEENLNAYVVNVKLDEHLNN